jgi:glycosyltransferase involved in cell wall biosynthesis
MQKTINTKSRPTVSVVVAAFNEEKYLHEALASILAQTDVHLEVIFVDDQSTDRTAEIARNFSTADRRLSVHVNPQKGKCSAFNFGISKSRGELVCIFAGDDIMPQGSLAIRADAVSKAIDCAPTMGLSKLVTMSDDKRFDGVVVPKARGIGALSGVSPMMNRAAVSLAFPVPETLPNEDTWMELAALHLPKMTLLHSDVICCKWRVHSGNSINMMAPFSIYTKKLADRNQALELFYKKFDALLDTTQRQILIARISCEQQRRLGSVVGVLGARLKLVEKLRVLSTTNNFLYSIRRRFYAFFSGR